MNPTLEFIHHTSWDKLPPDVQRLAARCLLDLTGTLIAGSTTDLSHAVRQVAFKVYRNEQATLLLDGRKTSRAGAALANGMTVDSIDAHDGYRLAKGHAGAGIFPAALAAGEALDWSGTDFLAALVVGYEVALRAAEALHMLASDYHSSGAWVALGSAVVMARAFGFDAEKTRHALGIAEYHGPRSEMMRCIDYPAMLKDGSGWGSMTGVMAAELADAGFTGAPAITVEQENVRPIWEDLGSAWRMRELYFKPYPCCRWAHPAIDAALTIVSEHGIFASEISALQVFTFEEAAHLGLRRPQNTEQAQYSLPFPVAAAVVHGGLNPAHVQHPSLEDQSILELAEKVDIQIDADLDARFPTEALAWLRLETTDGRTLESEITTARGGSEHPMDDDEIIEKFRTAVSASIAQKRAQVIQSACWGCAQLESIHELVGLLADPISARRN